MKEKAKGAANTGGIERRNRKMIKEGADKESNSRRIKKEKQDQDAGMSRQREQLQVEWSRHKEARTGGMEH